MGISTPKLIPKQVAGIIKAVLDPSHKNHLPILSRVGGLEPKSEENINLTVGTKEKQYHLVFHQGNGWIGAVAFCRTPSGLEYRAAGDGAKVLIFLTEREKNALHDLLRKNQDPANVKVEIFYRVTVDGDVVGPMYNKTSLRDQDPFPPELLKNMFTHLLPAEKAAEKLKKYLADRQKEKKPAKKKRVYKKKRK